jgi:hypothetical protein
VVEFGSGISTLYIARVLKQTGGHLTSFDDDQEWQSLVRQLLRIHHLSDYVSLVYAPSKLSRLAIDELEWYDEDIVKNSLYGKEIEMLVVDGPTAFKPASRLSRYPAFPVTKPFLSANSCIVLDDIERAGERKILSMWRREDGFEYSINIEHSGIAMCYCGPRYNTRM